VEVYVDASLETCRKRDVKGLYKKAMAGQIQSFTGLDDPYEEPQHPEIIVKTDQQSIEQSEKTILDYIQRYL
jgi:adenylylsulfate kinase